MGETRKLFPAAGAGVRLTNLLLSAGEVVLRMPTDEEWMVFQRRFRSVLSRETEALAVADAFFRELAVEGSATVDAEDADYLLGRLLRFELTKAQEEDGRFELGAEALGGVAVTLRFRVPTVRRLRKDGDSPSVAADLALFDELLDETEGYAGAVPAYHKRPAAQALRAALYTRAAEIEQADFFDLTAATDGAGAKAS